MPTVEWPSLYTYPLCVCVCVCVRVRVRVCVAFHEFSIMTAITCTAVCCTLGPHHKGGGGGLLPIPRVVC